MRSPHNPQPTVNLGDDPDPAAEIGPRLAAASQTLQGLLTNYLFYGQRRSAQQDQLHAQTGTTARAQDQRHHQNDRSTSERTVQTARSQRARGSSGRAGTASVGADRPGPSRHAPGTPTLRLIEQQPQPNQAAACATGSSAPGLDALAVDPLTEDPLARDSLSSPAGPAPQTAEQAPPPPRQH